MLPLKGGTSNVFVMFKCHATLWLVVLSIFCWSCSEPETCVTCEGPIDSTFKDTFFGVFLNRDADTILVHYDSISNERNIMELCSTGMVKAIETTKVIKASGVFRNSCDPDGDKNVELQSVVVVESCNPQVPRLHGKYSLENIWFIEYIQTQDIVVYPPCEGDSFLVFDISENYLSGVMSINGFVVDYIRPNDSTIKLSDSFGAGLIVGTNSQSRFEQIFQQLASENSILTYSIKGNTLTLKNKEKNSLIKLYTMERGS